VSEDQNEEEDEPPEENLILIALTGIEDPVRPEVPGAVLQCMVCVIPHHYDIHHTPYVD